jgi:hypothetical protein
MEVVANSIYNRATVRQRTKDGYFNATDLIKIYNNVTGTRKDISDFIRLKSTIEFADVIILKESDTSIPVSNDNLTVTKPVIETKKGGKEQGTWMHPYMFIDFAMWLSPEFKYNTIKWVHDNLIQIRISSGDNYVAMCAAFSRRYREIFGEPAPSKMFQREAERIREIMGIGEKPLNEWTETELQLRNELQITNIISFDSGYSLEQRMELLMNTKKIFELRSKIA